MAIELELDEIVSGYNVSKINGNFQRIEVALQDAVSRSGETPNAMDADLDLNGNDILNAELISAERIEIAGEVFTTDSVIAQGEAGTITLGVVQTGAPGTNVIITNTGDTHNAVFDFTIPRGDVGASGAGSGDMNSAANLSDVANTTTSFNNIKQTASTSYAGVSELATLTEALAGSNTNVIGADIIKQIIDLICPVGTVKPYLGLTAPSGWLILNGGTIGNATSGATSRANADTSTLFSLLWTLDATAILIYTSAGVLSTRGANAAADFAANKRIALPDFRSEHLRGADNGRAVNTGKEAGETLAENIGTHVHSGTTSTGGSHSHTGLTSTDGAHTHQTNVVDDDGNFGEIGFPNSSRTTVFGFVPTSAGGSHFHSFTTSTGGSHNHTITVSAAGSGELRPRSAIALMVVKY